MTRISRKTGFEEKGQRTARSSDVYAQKEAGKEVSYCRKCGLIYHQKRWVMNQEELERVKGDPSAVKITCPACQKMQDNVPGGYLTLSGDYLLKHESEILELIKNTEEKSRNKNPLGRIMEIRQENNVLTILTTEDKIAQKLGRDIYKAHSGELHYQWSHTEKYVRVNWTRTL
jgi:NMD protein affecting ribosome stability and mRNA decay